jgi:hypothetical protein
MEARLGFDFLIMVRKIIIKWQINYPINSLFSKHYVIKLAV